MVDISVSDWLALFAVIIALLSLVYTYKSNTKKYELTSQARNEILEWYSSTVYLLIRLKDLGEKERDIKPELLARLSAQIEVGRFYFPNLVSNFGEEKPLAYRGTRAEPIELLVSSYFLFDRADSQMYREDAEMLEREFTSYIFDFLKTREHLEEVEQHTNVDYHRFKKIEDYLRIKRE